MRENNYANKHIVLTLVNALTYATKLPGGIHRGVAPPNTISPFLVFAYSSGNDALFINSNALGSIAASGLVYLIKVQDEGASSGTRASDVATWVEDTILAANGSSVSGAYVYGQRISPFSLPSPEGDAITQQEGGSYRFWVDRI